MQSTVLGPLLFLILMTDISTNVISSIVSSADHLYLGVNDASDETFKLTLIKFTVGLLATI